MGTAVLCEEEATKGIFGHPAVLAKFLGFTLFDYQIDFLDSCMNYNRILGCWSRQTGKSTTIALYCVWHALVYPNSSILIISPTQEQSNLLFQKIIFFLYKKDAISSQIKRFQMERIELFNGSILKALPTGAFGISIRGHSADLIIEEESGHIKSTIVHEVIGPMGAAQSYLKYIKIGTPFSRGHFYDAMMSNRYKIHKYTWKEGVRNGLMKQEFIDEQMDQLTHMQFQTEYCAEFISDVDSYFSYDLIQSCIEEYPLIVL